MTKFGFLFPKYIFVLCVNYLVIVGAGHRHRHSGIRYVSLVLEHSGTGLGPLIPVPYRAGFAIGSFVPSVYRTDWTPHIPAFRHFKKGYIHTLHVLPLALSLWPLSFDPNPLSLVLVAYLLTPALFLIPYPWPQTFVFGPHPLIYLLTSALVPTLSSLAL
jgi:hypothetical protein